MRSEEPRGAFCVELGSPQPSLLQQTCPNSKGRGVVETEDVRQAGPSSRPRMPQLALCLFDEAMRQVEVQGLQAFLLRHPSELARVHRSGHSSATATICRIACGARGNALNVVGAFQHEDNQVIGRCCRHKSFHAARRFNELQEKRLPSRIDACEQGSAGLRTCLSQTLR